MHISQGWIKGGITALLIILIALSWSRHLDEAAHDATLNHFKRALAVAAIARGFNGVLSVAQGTEVAIQPVGIGVTLTIGEILDPLNDLVERFSALALVASVSLGLQLTLGQMLASPWLSGLMTMAVLAYLIALWRGPTRLNQALGKHKVLQFSARLMMAAIFLRFMLAVALLATHFVDAAYLASQQDQAVSNLTSAVESIEQLQAEDATNVTADEGDLFDRTATQLRNFMDASKQTVDLKGQLQAVEDEVEQSVEEIINLIVIFLLQTLLLPIASLWACGWGLRYLWAANAQPTVKQTPA